MYCVSLPEALSIFLRSIAMYTRSEAMSLSMLLPQILWVMNVCVSTLPTFCASRHSNLYSIGVSRSSSPLTEAVFAA